MIVMRVELPVEEMLGRSDVEGVAQDGSSTMRGRAQLNNLWTE